jgi:hypothetical protein
VVRMRSWLVFIEIPPFDRHRTGKNAPLPGFGNIQPMRADYFNIVFANGRAETGT